ncbi:MAG: hypothetical protein ACI9FJ_001267, partial [Alteromonadaceae bacterium]
MLFDKAYHWLIPLCYILYYLVLLILRQVGYHQFSDHKAQGYVKSQLGQQMQNMMINNNKHHHFRLRHPQLWLAIGTGLLVGSLHNPVFANQFGQTLKSDVQLQMSDMTRLKPQIPKDLYRKNNQVSHRDLATFAWLEFIALNASADTHSRG